MGTELINGTPTGLIPKMGEYPVANAAFYQQLLITDAPARPEQVARLDRQLDPYGPQRDQAEDLPAVGVLLTFEQGWWQEGLALGELRKSLSLAPGEVTKIATVDWRRTMRSRDEASRDQTETTSAETDDASHAHSVQQAVLKESTSGFAMNASTSTQKENAASGGGLIWGVSHSSASNRHMGFSASAAHGNRQAAAAAAANIQRSTEQNAQAVRSTRATQIREVTEDEQQSVNTRVVANYNHAHALTMQYYEVLQIYSLDTRVVRADRCVFVPVDPLSFSRESMLAFSDKTVELLRRTVRELGLDQLDEQIGEFHKNAPNLEDKMNGLRTRVAELKAAQKLAETSHRDTAAKRDQVAAELQRLQSELTSAAA